MSKAKIFLFLQLVFYPTLAIFAQDPGGPDSMWLEVDNVVIPADTGGVVTFRIKLHTDNSGAGNEIVAATIPLNISNSNEGASPVLDNSLSALYTNTIFVQRFSFLGNTIFSGGGNPAIFPLQILLGWVDNNAPFIGITSGTYTCAFLKVSLSDTTTICIDTTVLNAQHLTLTTKSPVVDYHPNWQNLCSQIAFAQNPETLTITAYSPVNLVVTDPKQDSIGLNFNTILEGSTYDTTQDVSVPPDGEKDDVVRIPKPYVGEYKIRVVPEDTGHYSLGIRIDGSDRVYLANNQVVPETSTTYEYSVLTTLRGDVNKDTRRNLTDIIYLVNYVFKGGTAPNPVELGNVNCSTGAPNLTDIIYMVNYVFKGGKAPCS